MPSTINIWEEANMESLGAQPSGTWNFTGSQSPAPTPPATYNGTADFSGVSAEGDYEFTYTVNGVTAKYTVQYSTSNPRSNDTCANAFVISGTVSVPFTVVIEDDNNQSCSTFAAPTDSGETYPASWTSYDSQTNYPDLGGDLWYTFTAPAKSEQYILQFKVQSEDPFVSSISAMNPAIQVFTGSVGDNCSSKLSEKASVGTGSNSIFTALTIPAGTSKEVWVRIASGNPANFTLTIEAICQ